MIDMTDDAKERHKAAIALIAWFKSQDILPRDAVPVLCTAIVLAFVSLQADIPPSPEQKKQLYERVDQIPEYVRAIIVDMVDGVEDFSG